MEKASDFSHGLAITSVGRGASDALCDGSPRRENAAIFQNCAWCETGFAVALLDSWDTSCPQDAL